MRYRIVIIFLAVVLFLTGCKPIENVPEQPVEQDPVIQSNESDRSEQPDSEEIKQTATLRTDIGTTPENITNGFGYFAMSDGFVYITPNDHSGIWEYDMQSGKVVEIPMRKAEVTFSTSGSQQYGFGSRGNLFLLNDGIGFLERSIIHQEYENSKGEKQLRVDNIQSLCILEYDGGKCTVIPELGEYVYLVVPIEKQEKAEITDANNPLAGLDLYYYCGHDTFPEMAAQMAELGMTLEEPTDPEERNRYIVPSLGHMDGDTRETEILTSDFIGAFFVDEQYVYIIREDSEEELHLFRCARGQRNFEPLDLGGGIGNYILPYDGGFYFWRGETWQICWYKDGEITEFPITGGSFIRWRNQLIYHDDHWQRGTEYDPIKSYNLDTGEIRTLCEDTVFPFCVLDDRYLACIQYQDDSDCYVLVDLETGELTEMYKPESAKDDLSHLPEDVQQSIEEEVQKKLEEEMEKLKEQKKQQESSEP